MKKYRILLLCTTLPVILLTGCNMADYSKAQKEYQSGNYEQAIELFEALADYKDSPDMLLTCKYESALEHMKNEEYLAAYDLFTEIESYQDSSTLAVECLYDLGYDAYDSGDWEKAIEYLTDLEYAPEGLPSSSDLILLSEAHESYDSEDYETVVELLDDYSGKNAEMIYTDAAEQVFISQLSAAAEIYSSDDTLTAINEYYDRCSDADSILSELQTLFSSLADQGIYDAFPYMDSTVSGIENLVDCSSLTTLIDGSYDKRVTSYLIGKWMRSDDTPLSGAILEVVKSGDELMGIMRDVTNVADAQKVVFVAGDIKWKDISVISATEITLEDMSIQSDLNTREILHTDYDSAIVQIDYANSTLGFHVTKETVDIPGYNMTSTWGDDQIWVKVTEEE